MVKKPSDCLKASDASKEAPDRSHTSPKRSIPLRYLENGFNDRFLILSTSALNFDPPKLADIYNSINVKNYT